MESSPLVTSKRQKLQHQESSSAKRQVTMATATDVESSQFFQDRRDADQLVVRDPPKFDLESYILHYEGRTRLDRLAHIGTSSTYLAVDALRLAIQHTLKGNDVESYTLVADALKKVAPSDPAGDIDTNWVDRKNKTVKAEGERLEQELKSYRNNLIKESIRMGNEDLGRHYYDAGDLPESWKAYHRMRDYCTNVKHIQDMLFRLVLVAIQQRQWQSAQAQLIKVLSQAGKTDDKEDTIPAIHALNGLCNMELGNFRDAAKRFMQTKFTYGTVEKQGQIAWQKEVMTSNDIAVYGGLCALASMDRHELQSQVLENPEFRQFLELEPHIRRAISLFCSSKYSACLEVLEAYRTDYLLDVYLQPVLGAIYQMVRSKSIVQYFIPFSCVTLDEMASAFQTAGGPKIEDELVQMIENGMLNARIDLVERLLLSPKISARHAAHQNAIEAAQAYEDTLRLRLLRLNMLSAGLDIKAPQRGGHGGSQTMDPRFDEADGEGSRRRRILLG